jgi:hypothetical protein
MSIDTYTPDKFRSELRDKMFNFIYDLLPKIPAEQ